MKLIQEKLAKSVANFAKSYANTPGDYSQLYVVFEFECYLTAETEEIEVERDYIIAEEPENYEQYLKDFFYVGGSVKKKMKIAYEEWFSEQIEDRVDAYLKKNPKENYAFARHLLKRQYADEFPLSRFFAEDFESFRAMCDYFDIVPTYEWVDDYQGGEDENAFYTEDYPEPNDNEEDKIDTLGNDLRRHFSNQNVRVYRSGTGPSIKDSDSWYVVRDSSLDGEYDENRVAVEIISPWISGDEVLEKLTEFKEFFDDHDGRTNRKTGGHINIRFVNDVQIDWLKLFLLSHEYADLLKFHRNKNEYCESVMKQLKQKSRGFGGYKDTDTWIKSRDGLEQFASIIRDGFRTSKYHSINLEKFFSDQTNRYVKTGRQGFVEFRIPGHDYLGKKYSHYRAAVVKYMNLMFAAATDNKTYDKEYMIRLIRLYHAIKEHQENSTKSNMHQMSFENTVVYIAKHYSITECAKEIFSGLRYINKVLSDPNYQDQEFNVTIQNTKNLPPKITTFHSNSWFKQSNIWFCAALYKMIDNKVKDSIMIEWINKIKSKNNSFDHTIDIRETLTACATLFPEIRDTIHKIRDQS